MPALFLDWSQGVGTRSVSLRAESDRKAIWAVFDLLPLIFSLSLYTPLLQHLLFSGFVNWPE